MAVVTAPTPVIPQGGASRRAWSSRRRRSRSLAVGSVGVGMVVGWCVHTPPQYPAFVNGLDLLSPGMGPGRPSPGWPGPLCVARRIARDGSERSRVWCVDAPEDRDGSILAVAIASRL